MDRPLRIRRIVNAVNLSTPLGLLLAAAGSRGSPARGRCRGPDGLILAGGYRWPLPAAPVFTVGNVVTARRAAADLLDRPALLRHEGRHATQYAFLLGPLMIPLYLVCAGVSLVLCGDHASANPFERQAGLADGGYTPHRVRWPFRR
ncbi:hypothetical protein BTM25_53370 [Actinomadura rubteroloni]|uniref:DUF4157 domain-containing protein n=1 Tax=Actinomadura rubteroloni TaxID=1926885 RepID=A0A2P4UBG1_9ACTN|nr:hypothetical protein [Actinomadura rubteroloni]POM22387.1 hypothetical protein BTM25_53370 [Actinomadura rubteroloni]